VGFGVTTSSATVTPPTQQLRWNAAHGIGKFAGLAIPFRADESTKTLDNAQTRGFPKGYLLALTPH
jgi:hypothetical protein